MKRLLAALLIVMFVFAGCGASDQPAGDSGGTAKDSAATTPGNTAGSDPGKIEKVVVTFRTFGSPPKDVALVQEEVNKILREKIGVEMELVIIQSGAYMQQMTLMLAGNEKLDCMGATTNIFLAAYNNDQLKPIDGLLEQYGQDILKVIDPMYLKVGKLDGKQYGITTVRDYPREYGGWLMRKDILEKHNIDVSGVDSYEKLTEVFAAIKAKEPEMIIVSPGNTGQSFLNHNAIIDNLPGGNSDYHGVLLNYGQELKVENLYSSEWYRYYLDTVRKWFLAGYMSPDVANTTEAGLDLIKAGNVFATSCVGKPGIVEQSEMSAGRELVYVQTLETFTSTAAPILWQWFIPENSTSPEAAMKFYNEMYTNPDVMNLLSWGIEGQHYAQKGDGMIGFPEGVTAGTSGYNLNMTWQWGNEFIAHVWEADADLWKQTAEFNKTGKVSKALGFVFNPEPVSAEVAAVTSVVNEYYRALELGVVDPDEVLPEMLKRMDTAGLPVIMKEKQRQLDEWAKAEGVS